MKLVKTNKAKAELKPGARSLGQRERSLLLLADGHKPLREISRILSSDVQSLADALVQSGYLAVVQPEVRSGHASPKAGGIQLVPASGTEPSAPASSSADQFEGKRSLATTRMFLFDICERMFTRPHPDLADGFRTALREAKDRESMLTAARQMIAEIERLAGADRADSISERIAMMLPVDASPSVSKPVTALG
jgi:hypothetical protein